MWREGESKFGYAREMAAFPLERWAISRDKACSGMPMINSKTELESQAALQSHPIRSEVLLISVEASSDATAVSPSNLSSDQNPRPIKKPCRIAARWSSALSPERADWQWIGARSCARTACAVQR